MSRIQPATAIIGSSPQRDKLGMPVMGIIEPLKKADGKFVGDKPLLARPLFNNPKPLGTVSHWVNEAAKRRAGGDMTKALPSELVQVPLYRGTSARFYNELRADHRKQQKRSLMQRIRAEIASRMATQAEGASA